MIVTLAQVSACVPGRTVTPNAQQSPADSAAPNGTDGVASADALSADVDAIPAEDLADVATDPDADPQLIVDTVETTTPDDASHPPSDVPGDGESSSDWSPPPDLDASEAPDLDASEAPDLDASEAPGLDASEAADADLTAPTTDTVGDDAIDTGDAAADADTGTPSTCIDDPYGFATPDGAVLEVTDHRSFQGLKLCAQGQGFRVDWFKLKVEDEPEQFVEVWYAETYSAHFAISIGLYEPGIDGTVDPNDPLASTGTIAYTAFGYSVVRLQVTNLDPGFYYFRIRAIPLDQQLAEYIPYNMNTFRTCVLSSDCQANTATKDTCVPVVIDGIVGTKCINCIPDASDPLCP